MCAVDGVRCVWLCGSLCDDVCGSAVIVFARVYVSAPWCVHVCVAAWAVYAVQVGGVCVLAVCAGVWGVVVRVCVCGCLPACVWALVNAIVLAVCG